uniref:tetratricopeptide repeat-containing sensor histidine kinase n=1 Tax=uncultured Polaribacter sp. TaxID=174711 RepID=UPI002630A616|nr:tetratricopeptide repeat protein [uncultured Polaribacter sp.]
MKLKTILTAIMLCLTVQYNAQNKILDSLKIILKTTKDSKQITNTYNNIGKIYNSLNTDSAIFYLRIAEKMAKKNKLQRHLFQAYSNIGTTFIKTGQLDSSEVYFDKAKYLINDIDFYNALTSYYGDRGILDYYKGDYLNSGKRFEKALDLAIKEKNIEDIIRYSNNSALVLSKTGKNNEALDIYFKALKSAELEKDSVHIGLLFNNIANIYEDMNEQEKSLDLYKKSLEIKLKHGTFVQIVNAYFNVANRQLHIGELENDSTLLVKAEKNYEKALEIAQEKNFGNGKLVGWEGLGKIELNKKNFIKSKEYFNKVLEVAKATKNKPYLNMANLSLAYIENDLKNHKKAEFYLKQSKDFVEKSGSITQKKQLYENLYIVEENKGNYKKAFEYLRKKNEIDETLTSNEIKEKISRYEVKYETEKKEKEIAQQKEQLLEQELAIKNRNLYAIIITSILLILGIIFFAIYKRNQFKRNQLQKEIDLKDALAIIKTQNRLQEQRLRISRDLHDNIGSQLTFIISSIDNLKFISKDANEKLKSKLATISSFTGDTIHQLRDTIWAMNKSEISIEDLHSRILSYIEKAKIAVPEVKIDVNYDIDKNKSFSSLIGMNIFRTLQEAINNAIKYSESNTIEITLKNKKNNFVATVTDFGKGFAINSVELGNGLSNMEKRMSEIGGTIKITSEEKKGTTIQLEVQLENTMNDV